MITVAELITKLGLCPQDAKVLFAELGSSEARTLSPDVYGEAHATLVGGEAPESVVLLTCVDQSASQTRQEVLTGQLNALAAKLEEMTAEKDRWLARVLKLEHRLGVVREALTLELPAK